MFNAEDLSTPKSLNAIERMYITMRHLFNRGFYKPMGISGETLRQSLSLLRPEIYGSIGEEKAELEKVKWVSFKSKFFVLGVNFLTHHNTASKQTNIAEYVT